MKTTLSNEQTFVTLSNEQAFVVIDTLMKQGVILPSQVMEAVLNNPTPDVCRIIDIYHTMFCKAEHNGDCFYYDEDRMENCWQMPVHRKWSEKMTQDIRTFNILGISELRELLKEVGSILTAIQKSSKKEFIMYAITSS